MSRLAGGHGLRAVAIWVLLGLALIAAGASTVAAQATGSLAGNIPAHGGVALVTWSGGPVEGVPGAAAESGCTAVSAWVTTEGELVGHVFRAPSFVNARFGSVTDGGNLAASTPLVLVCGAGVVAPPPPSDPALHAPNLADYLPSGVAVGGYTAAVRSRDAGQYDLAAVQFGQVASAGGPLAPVAMMRAAQMLQIADRDGEAVDAFELALGMGGLPPPLEMVARLDAANTLWRLDRDAEVLAMLARVTLGNGAAGSQLAQAGWLRAQAKRAAGDAGWTADALAVVANYPGTSSGRSALNAIEGRAAVPPLDAAYVRYLHHQDATARTAYLQVATTGAPGDAAVAWFYVGALAERAGERDEAIEAYRSSVQLDASSRVADDAHWWAAYLLAQAGRDAEAVEHWSALSAGYPSSSFAADAGVRAALAHAESGVFGPAESVLRTMLNGSSGSSAARAARWLRVLEQEAPGPAQYDPRSVYAILDAAGAASEAPLPQAALGEWSVNADTGWGEAAAWMQARYGAPPGGALHGADTVRLALTLAEAGEGAVARSVLYGHIETLAGRPYDLLAFSRLTSAAGLHDVSISAATRLLDGIPSSGRLQTPRAIERLAYPTPFAPEIRAAAQAEGIPPLLLTALVRRESLFNPDAGSSAGAQGLAQVIPSTGRAIAESLGVPWEPGMLFDPATSVRFGAHYLSAQLTSFEGNVWNALSAYNGGPGNASRWSRSQPFPGADWYIETVDFEETRRYLRVVIEDYAWYRYLYAGAPAPSMR
ncbi:MAG: transglycosylase SLT domain-containing protein [Dehalococcoidia bacterium]|nr:transglycosylase SLT domain-containing protein [Dehalococcoidia bacterium]